MDKYKKVLEKKELYIQFSDEEINEIGWEEGQKLSISYDEDTNAIALKPYVKVDIDMSEWSRELLEFLVSESCRKDVSCNQIVEDVLVSSLNIKNKSKRKEQLLCEDYEG
jgi:hypothetical protein